MQAGQQACAFDRVGGVPVRERGRGGEVALRLAEADTPPSPATTPAGGGLEIGWGVALPCLPRWQRVRAPFQWVKFGGPAIIQKISKPEHRSGPTAARRAVNVALSHMAVRKTLPVPVRKTAPEPERDR
jgi:hypothetical protein